MSRKGFTLIELLVVIVIIGILVAIALPNFIKIKDKAKEAEVKQNLHAIQLALERYSTDAEGGYPYFLYGGDSMFNMGSISGVSGTGYGTYNIILARPINPFDMFALSLPDNAWCYTRANWSQMLNRDPAVEGTFGDTLGYEGYLPKYPGNPFAQGQSALRTFGIDARIWNYRNFYCFGGYEGNKMWNTGWMSELNTLHMFSSQQQTDVKELLKSELPGNFSYHARWSDDHTNFEHMGKQQQYNPASYWHSWVPALRQNIDKISSLDVFGYDLVATGSPRTKGQDLDNSVKIPSWPLGHWFRTGYVTLGQERNPYVGQNEIYDGVAPYGERPYSDSVPDFTIIHLGSGIDKKVGTPDQN